MMQRRSDGGMLGHEIIFGLRAIFVEELVNGARKEREFFFGENFYHFDGFIGLLFSKPLGLHPVDQFLHIMYLKLTTCPRAGRQYFN
jgi:hypothetical protein